MLINNQIKNIDFCPFVHTEETFIKSIIDFSNFISDEYELMPYPLAHWLNTFDVKKTNEIISNLHSDKKRVFVCQHIFVGSLNFKNDDIVLTPHSSENDNFISIPHFAINWDKKYIREKKEYKFSFLGSSKTHIIRNKLIELYTQNCFDSGHYWGLDKNMTKDFNDRYIEMMGNSYFSICPRGTGISSIRLFECIYMNSIPVIIADGYKKPLSDIINWDEFSITILEEDIDKIEEIINSISEDKIEKMQKILKLINEEYINNNIIEIIKKKLNLK